MTDLASANRLAAPELAMLLAMGMTHAELPRGFHRRGARLAEAYDLMTAEEATAKRKIWVEPPAYVPLPKAARVRTGRVRCEAA